MTIEQQKLAQLLSDMFPPRVLNRLYNTFVTFGADFGEKGRYMHICDLYSVLTEAQAIAKKGAKTNNATD